MRKLALSFAFAATVMSGPSYAQVTIDASKVTCAEYLAMSPDYAGSFSGWMSGWFNQRTGYVYVGLSDFSRNIASIRQWCNTYPREPIMAALERANPQPTPTPGQVRVDMSLITCKQYLSSDREQQDIIADWMSGYFHASKGQPVFDFGKFSKNKKAVTNYCKKRGGETLMSAIQKSAR